MSLSHFIPIFAVRRGRNKFCYYTGLSFVVGFWTCSRSGSIFYHATISRMDKVTISTTVRSHPQLPYTEIKNVILGKEYMLSLSFIGTTRAKKINESTCNKSYVPNVLSFPLTPTCGEIYITPVQAQKEASKFDLSPQGYIGFLYIHGLLHLKGLTHGSQMDTKEKQYLKKFNLT
ncbi:MAG: rRNA maturation RNase YbeY [Candidatus Paceibacterota bacterium]